jgi:hypothetical protein
MPSTSAAQHRWIGYLHSNPEAREHSGMSQAKVDEWLHSDKGSPWKRAMGGGMMHRDDGGSMGSIGGITPSSSTENPISQSIYQKYAGLSTEKLQELSAAYGKTSTQGQIVSKLLSQRQMMPNTTAQTQQYGQQQQGAQQTTGMQAQTTQQPQSQQASQQGQTQTFQPQQLASEFQQTPTTGMQASARGGGLATGGNPMGVSMSMADPWWTRQEARGSDSGLLSGNTFGRADSVKTSAPSGSYVLPAEMISGLGEGNTLSGPRVVSEMTSTGPYGTALPRITHGRGPPSPAHVQAAQQAKGGGVQEGPEDHTPVALSHGEIVLSPQQCIEVVSKVAGRPVPLKYAHKVLDAWVKIEHKKHADKLAKLAKQGPVTT